MAIVDSSVNDCDRDFLVPVVKYQASGAPRSKFRFAVDPLARPVCVALNRCHCLLKSGSLGRVMLGLLPLGRP